MGMYLTVYVYKGCEHLVQGNIRPAIHSTKLILPGMDKDFVTAGLARGRVGNKGGM
jgi:hypothetical protein